MKAFRLILVFALSAVLPAFAEDPKRESEKLKVLSLDDVKKWDFQMTRVSIDKLVDSEAVLFATMHCVIFKAKEGGAYNVDFVGTKGKPFPYKLYSVYYLPNYPDEDPHHLIMKDKPLPPLPK